MSKEIPLRRSGEIASKESFGSLMPVYEEFTRMVEMPAGGDYRISKFGLAARWLMHNEPRFLGALSNANEFRSECGRPTPPAYLANLTLRCAQHLLRGERNYAYISTDQKLWAERIVHLLDRADKEVDLVTLPSLMMYKEIQTVVDARYKAAQLYIALHPDQFKRPIRYLDLGTSAGIGAKSLMIGQIQHRVNARVIVPGETPRNTPSASLVIHPALTKHIQSKLYEPIFFEKGVGVDITDPTNEAETEWIKSCYYPSEVAENKNKMMTKFDHLTRIPMDNWQALRKIDCSRPESAGEIQSKSNLDKFDLITIFTTLGQMSEDERTQTILNARQLLAPGGALLVSDFAKTNAETPSGLEFFPVWDPYTYRTLRYMEDGWEDVFWWKGGRCTDVILYPTYNIGSAPPEIS